MRLFIALDIDEDIRKRISRFVEGVRNFAPDARWMKPESMHVTLKFLGEQPEDAIQSIKKSLTDISAGGSEIHFRGYGFFPTATSARVFWVGMDTGHELAAMARMIDDKIADLGIPKEEGTFRPHLTLARRSGGSGSPHRNKKDGRNQTFQKLQKQLSALPAPEFGTMRPREFFLYQSQLSPKGSKYTKLARFALQ